MRPSPDSASGPSRSTSSPGARSGLTPTDSSRHSRASSWLAECSWSHRCGPLPGWSPAARAPGASTHWPPTGAGSSSARQSPPGWLCSPRSSRSSSTRCAAAFRLPRSSSPTHRSSPLSRWSSHAARCRASAVTQGSPGDTHRAASCGRHSLPYSSSSHSSVTLTEQCLPWAWQSRLAQCGPCGSPGVICASPSARALRRGAIS